MTKANRRPLIAGLEPGNSVDPALEKAFVYGAKASPTTTEAPPPAAEMPEGKGQMGKAIARVPFTTRVRSDFAAALKRASLERQLKGVTPHKLQEILEEALEPWLRANGYLP